MPKYCQTCYSRSVCQKARETLRRRSSVLLESLAYQFIRKYLEKFFLLKKRKMPYLKNFELKVDCLDDDGLIKQHSARMRDDVSVTNCSSAKCSNSQKLSLSLNESPKARNPKRSSFSNIKRPRPTKIYEIFPFFVRSNNQLLLSKFLN